MHRCLVIGSSGAPDPSGLATPIFSFSLSSLEPKSLRMVILTIILVQVLCCHSITKNTRNGINGAMFVSVLDCWHKGLVTDVVDVKLQGAYNVDEACLILKMGFAPLYKREISLGPSSDSDQEMHGHAGVKSEPRIPNHRIEKRAVGLELDQIS